MEIKLDGNKLYIEGIQRKDFKILYDKFRVDLLDSNILHYRPVAFRVEGAVSTTVLSNISKIPGIGYSFSELSFILNNIITNEKKGVMPEQLNAMPSLTRLRSDCSFITLIGDRISTLEEGSIFYCGEGVQSVPNVLNKELTIFNKLRTSIGITVILMRGRGTRDFADNQRLVYNTQFKPMRANYSLFNLFSVRQYLNEDYLYLDYKEDLNKDVLASILNDYFNQKEVISCLNLK